MFPEMRFLSYCSHGCSCALVELQRLLLFIFFQIYFVELKKKMLKILLQDSTLASKWVLTQILFHPSLMNNLK